MKTYEKDLKEIMVMLTNEERQNIQDCADTFYDLLQTFGCDMKGEVKFQSVERGGFSKEIRNFLRDARVTYEMLRVLENILTITGYKDKDEDEDEDY